MLKNSTRYKSSVIQNSKGIPLKEGGKNWDASDPCLSKKGSTKCGISPMKILPTPWKKMQDMIL